MMHNLKQAICLKSCLQAVLVKRKVMKYKGDARQPLKGVWGVQELKSKYISVIFRSMYVFTSVRHDESGTLAWAEC